MWILALSNGPSFSQAGEKLIRNVFLASSHVSSKPPSFVAIAFIPSGRVHVLSPALLSSTGADADADAGAGVTVFVVSVLCGAGALLAAFSSEVGAGLQATRHNRSEPMRAVFFILCPREVEFFKLSDLVSSAMKNQNVGCIGKVEVREAMFLFYF
jgi:hypothetical protein